MVPKKVITTQMFVIPAKAGMTTNFECINLVIMSKSKSTNFQVQIRQLDVEKFPSEWKLLFVAQLFLTHKQFAD